MKLNAFIQSGKDELAGRIDDVKSAFLDHTPAI